jgi:choline dehydrogenase-like flavoprotein
LFGGVMLRPSRDDFAPGRHYADKLPRDLWEWPIDYHDLAPYFDRAESLWGLAAGEHDDFGPLEPPRPASDRPPLPLAPINRRLMQRNRSRGLRPFQLPLAIDSRQCAACDQCAGFLCPHEARRSAAHLVRDAARRDGLQLWTEMEVERVTRNGTRAIDGLSVRHRATGEVRTLRARRYALAAGAIGSAALLLKSGFEGRHVGRHYMLHYAPLAIGLFAGKTQADQRFVKQVGFADFYFGTPELPRKMGLVQSLPAPGPLMLAKAGLRRWPRSALQALRSRMLPLAGIVEDLPHPANRLTVHNDGSICLTHAFSPFDRERGRALARAMRGILHRTGALARVSRPFPTMEHVAHQCGTLRFGRSAETSVVDPAGRLWGQENMLVVDGSVLPTSLGVGPSLTIAAHALRAADIALQEM